MSFTKHLLMKKNIDPVNKEYFTETHPVCWFALGMLLCLVSATGMFECVESISDFFYFLAFALGALWCAYNFIVILFYSKAPSNSPARLQWLQKRERNRALFSKYYEILLAPIVSPLIKIIGYLILCGLFIGGYAFISSLSIHALLVLIAILLLIK